jgi:RES domain
MYGDLISTVVDFDNQLYRNIKGIRESQSLFDDLGDDEDVLAAVVAECLDKRPNTSPLISRPFDYGTVITFPLLPVNWEQTRFSNSLAFGVWYGSLEVETTVYETVYHWRRFVLDSFPEEDREIIADRRLFKVRCQGILIDLRGKEGVWPALVNQNSYEFTQGLGDYLHKQRQNGLLVMSARCNGVNTAILNPSVLSNVLDVCYLIYKFNPVHNTVVDVERQPGVTWLQI